MVYVLYFLAGVSMLLAVGGLSAYMATKRVGLLLSSLVSIACALTAIATRSFWPLLLGFAINWGLKLAGLDPSSRR
ncbi:MAG: hypothetical protein RLY78_770 [Pseudomonadota bacterium]|jgi:uncharacterized membrane protein